MDATDADSPVEPGSADSGRFPTAHGLSVALIATKLAPPVSSPGLLPRTGIVEQLALRHGKLSPPFLGQDLVPVNDKLNQDLDLLSELLEAGEVTRVVDRTYPLSDVPEAMRYLEEGHARGKIVIIVAVDE